MRPGSPPTALGSSLRAGLGLAGALLLLAGRGGAESALRLVAPPGFGPVEASTYDGEGQRVGPARLGIEELPDGHLRIYSQYGFAGGARAQASAELAPVAGTDTYRILREQSRSQLPDGAPVGALEIDHQRGIATCTPPDGASVRVPLPDPDRVVHVPLHLLFVPLVRGEQERVAFQMLVCRGTPRLIDFAAWVERREAPIGQGEGIVEVRWEPDLGPLPSLLAHAFLPRLASWFDAASHESWLAHRVPLYSRGPEVTVMREGAPPRLLHDGS